MIIKNRKVVILLLVILVIAIIKIKKLEIDYTYSTKGFVENFLEMDINNIKIENIEDIDNAGMTLSLVLEGSTEWNKLQVSENFKKKYKKGQDIIKNKNEYTGFSYGICREMYPHKKNVIWLCGNKYDNIISTLKYGEPVSTEFIFEYEIDENNLLDDVKLIRKKDVYSISAERVDGDKEVTYENLQTYIHKIANPQNKAINEYYNDVPLASDCKELNKPNIEKLGIPKNSSCEMNGENVILTFDYGDYKKIWDVKYNINIDYKLDYVEFIEKI